MHTGPDRDETGSREHAARCLMAYLEQLPLATETRLELALETLRSLPGEATPEEALKALQGRLPAFDPAAYPPNHPEVERSHMPGQYLGRPRKGAFAFVVQWTWLAVLILLIILTLFMNNIQ